MAIANVPPVQDFRLKGAAPVTGYRLQSHLSVLVTALVLIVGGAIGGLGYLHSRLDALDAAEQNFHRVGQEAAVTVEVLFGPVETLVDIIARGRLPALRKLDEQLGQLPELAAALDRNPRIAALYAGYDDGGFFLLRPLRDERVHTVLQAPPAARYLVQSVGANGANGMYLWLDADLRELRREPRPDYRFDPRTRPWYQAAMRAEGLVRGEPYVFFTTREMGKTTARRAPDGRAAIGADLTLAGLSELMAERTRGMDPATQIAVFNAAGTVIAYRDPARAVVVENGAPRAAHVSDLASPPLMTALREAASGQPARMLAWSEDGTDWRVFVTSVPGEVREFLAVAVPVSSLLASANQGRTRTLLIIAGILAAAIPVAWWVARSVADPLERLEKETAAMRRFDFADPARPVRSRIIEVEEMVRALDATRSTIRRFLDVSRAVGAEQRFDALIDRVLDETLTIGSASVGVVRLATDDGMAMQAAMARGISPEQPPVALPPVVIAGTDTPLARAVRERRVIIEQVRGAMLNTAILAITGASEATVVLVPLFDRRGGVLGVLSLARTGAAHREPVSAELVSFLQALAGVLGVAIENQKLLRAQKDLLDAFIQLVAGSIDAKSPYTGGHCQRVPALTRMLAEAACEASEGPFADFKLTDEEWEAVHIASWLHDCGKVTTPEYVVDKATKLETLCDRLHEVRMRFEVLKRDAEIDFWKGVAQGGAQDEKRAALAAARDAMQRTLDEEFAFVAECNQGGEFMAPEKVERLKAIAARTWMRTLDDRIGLSHEELQRKSATPPAPLPAPEPLLADKPEHLFARPAAELIPEDNRWGFRLRVPEHKFNRGELHNLSVGRGTLSEEDRYIINDHIVQTIRMLTALPFPKHLRAVPEIAGGHHEKMDGTGYPKRLSREQMSLPARMMAIADIFEALTASDRPYKKAKTLSESIKIMGFMKKDGHVDPELFELFLTAGIHRRYAEQFLTPEQIDEVDIGPYLKAS